MILSIDEEHLKNYIVFQLEHFFPDDNKYDIPIEILNFAISRMEYNFSKINLPAYSNDQGQTFFNHLHSDQYSMFLYFLSNELFRRGIDSKERRVLCDKLMLLNRCLSGAFIPYKIELPDIFFGGHPVGTVLGHAKYSNYLIVMQGVTVSSGSEYDHIDSGGAKECPEFGEYVQLCSGCSVVGRPIIGNNVTIGVNATCHGIDIPDNSVLFQDKITGKITIKKRTRESSTMKYFR